MLLQDYWRERAEEKPIDSRGFISTRSSFARGVLNKIDREINRQASSGESPDETVPENDFEQSDLFLLDDQQNDLDVENYDDEFLPVERLQPSRSPDNIEDYLF